MHIEAETLCLRQGILRLQLEGPDHCQGVTFVTRFQEHAGPLRSSKKENSEENREKIAGRSSSLGIKTSAPAASASTLITAHYYVVTGQ